MKQIRRIKWALLATGVILAVGGCNAPVSLPAAIQPGTPVPTPTPTTTPTPSPSPTPTPVPVQVINQGQRDLRNGDWNAAMQAFLQVVTNPGATADEMVEAQLGLALAALRLGDFVSAKATLDSLLSLYPDHPRASQAYFLRGDARMGLSEWAGAITDFQFYLSLKPGLIDTYVYERIADSQLALGQIEQALASYDLALSANRYLVSSLQLREKVATINRSIGNTEGAVAQYQAILSLAQNAGYRATIEFSIGQAYFEAEQYDAAYEKFNEVFQNYPTTLEALSSLRALLEAGYEVDQYQRGMVNYYHDQYDIALTAFYNYLAGTPIDYPPDVHLYIAYSYRKLGNTQAALSELQGMVTRFDVEDGVAWSDAHLEIADIYAELGDIEGAYAAYDKFVGDYPTLPQAAEALYQAGRLAESLEDVSRAINYYQRLSVEYPDDTRSTQGLFRVGLLTYQAGDLATAETMFTNTAQMATTERPAANYLWLGKTLQTAGRLEEANTAFNNAITADGPTGYYALRATDLMTGLLPFSAPTNLDLFIDPDEGRTEAEQWLVERFGLTITPPLAETLGSNLASEPRMLRAKELWDLGLLVEAKQDFESVRKDFENDPLATYQLAIYFRDIGLYRSSILATWQIQRLADVGPLEVPAFLARLRYPVYFSDLVLSYSRQYDLDPLYVYALIWQESVFEGFAVSSASAQGLMQIWPPTGEDIAESLAWPNYRPSDLQRPAVNIPFGTWLLRDELNRFNGDSYAALAAYNAGSGRALDWEDASGGDPDLFVEMIDLQEPKIYIQRIYEHYAIYQVLYGVP